MKKPITLSLLVNITVLLPVCMRVITDAGFAQVGYGPSSAARSILLPIYIAIALFSVLLLFMRDPKFVAALLPDQSRLLPGFGYNGWNWPIVAAQETTLKEALQRDLYVYVPRMVMQADATEVQTSIANRR